MLTCLSKTANNSAVPFGIFIDTAVEEKKGENKMGLEAFRDST